MMKRGFIKRVALCALLAAGCNYSMCSSGNEVYNKKKIESRFNYPKFNVLHIMAKDVSKRHEDDGRSRIVDLTLDSRLCNTVEGIFPDYEISDCVLNPRLSDDKVESYIVKTPKGFLSAIDGHEGKIDVLYVYGHGNFAGKTRKIKLYGSNYLSPASLDEIDDDYRDELRSKFHEDSIAILDVCEAIDSGGSGDDIAHALADFLNIKVLASRENVFMYFSKIVFFGKVLRLEPIAFEGDWKTVFPGE